MFRYCVRGCRVLAVAVMAFAAGAASADETASAGSLRSFSGRSGATKEKVIVVGCANPEPTAPAGGLMSALGARVKEAHTSKTLRELVEGGSSDWLNKKPRSKEELLKQLPPKYHPIVKEYFEKLEKMQKDGK